MVRIAVLGCGRIGRMHADNIAAHPRAGLAGVFDIDAKSASAVAHRHGAENHPTAEAAIEADGTDAVLIATPTATHVEMIEKCVAAGKPVLCEKPIDLSLERVNQLKERIAGTKTPIMLGFARRFDPGHAAVRKAIEAGEVGELHQVVITSRDPDMDAGYIATSGGIFRDMTIHDLDLARFMLGEEVATVTATGSRLVDPKLMEKCGDYDTTSVTLTTASGKQALINNSRRAVYGYDQRVEAFGSKGMVVSNNHPENQVARFTAAATSVASPLCHFFIERYSEAYNIEIDLFVDAVENGAPVPVGFEDGRVALLLADACFMSIEQGRTINASEVG